MRFVFASYVYTAGYKRPEDWIYHVKFYGGMLEALAMHHTVISIEQIDYEGAYQHNGVQYYFKRTTKLDRRFPIKLHHFIRELRADVVFIHGLHFPLQVLQLRLCMGGKIKIVVQHHAEQPATGFKKILQQLADQYINAYLFASRDLGLYWINQGNLASSQKIHEVMEVSSIFYPVKKEKAHYETGVNGDPVFLWVGRLNQNKDPLNVVKAFLQYAESNIRARLYMIYNTAELSGEIKDVLDSYPNLKSAVVLIGKLPHEELLHWYNNADFIISGSFYEAAGTAVCEALSCGVVPVLTDIPSFRVMTDNGKLGFLYEAGNQQALYNCLLKATGIKKKEMQQSILDYYKANLSFSAIAGRISQIASSI